MSDIHDMLVFYLIKCRRGTEWNREGGKRKIAKKCISIKFTVFLNKSLTLFETSNPK